MIIILEIRNLFNYKICHNIIQKQFSLLINVKNSYLMNSLIPNSELIVIDNMRHLIEEEILDQFKNKLLEHLTQS